MTTILRPTLDPASLKVSNASSEMRYRFQPGLELLYRSTLQVFRNADASPRFSSRAKEEFVSDVRHKVIAQDEQDQGYYILSYHTPVERSLDGRPMPIGDGRIVYFKHTPLGHVLEASDPLEATVLLLPAPPVGVGSEWRVNQHHFPAGRARPIEVASFYRVNSVQDGIATLVFDSDEVRYEGDTAGTEGNVYTLVGKGRFEFDVSSGHLISLETESTMTSKEDDLLLEVVAMHSMHLRDDEDLPG